MKAFGCRQRRGVEFPVVTERQLIDGDESDRDAMRGQRIGKECPQLGRGGHIDIVASRFQPGGQYFCRLWDIIQRLQ